MIECFASQKNGGVVSSFVAGSVLLCTALMLRADPDPTWQYCVRMQAAVQASPPQITLQWEADDPVNFGATNFMVFRKGKTDTSWGSPLAVLPGSATSWTDTGVAVGSTYEYQVEKQGFPGAAFGYVYTGIQAPLTESRGKLVLVVATNVTASLEPEFARFESDLIGDGWFVIRHDVSSDDTPAHVRSLIVSDYNADPGKVNAVLLFGHVPVLQSGFMSYDGHDPRAMPADAYYGDMKGSWSGNDNTIPGNVELMVGRVDLSDLPGNLAPGTMPGEVQMLRNYLEKDHNWRFKQIDVPRRALLADRFGLLAPSDVRASSGYRNFAPFVGLGNTELADVSDTAAPGDRWMSKLANNSYLWAYACGGGQDPSISEMGTHGEYFDVWNTDLYAQDAKAVFFMLEGSHFGNWDHTDDIMRTVLGIPTMGLAVYCIAGHPQYYCQHVGLGEPLGYGVRLTMNNNGLYQDTTNIFNRAVYIGLMGDPTLRMEPVSPPSGLNGGGSGGVVTLNWFGSADGVVGYHVYRAAALIGPYTRLTDTPITDTSFQDTSPIAGGATYMVRAVALTENPSGSYYNPSQGVFLKIDSNGVGTTTGDTNTVVNAKPTPGSYNGLFYGSDGAELNQSGSITVTIAKKSTYSGKLQLGAKRYSLHGKLAADGTATNSVGKGGSAIEVRLSASAEPDKIVGSVSTADWSANILADRAVFNTRTNKASIAGNYTLRLPGTDDDPTQPAGDGYALIKVSPAGVAKVSGVLGDNTKFSQSAPVSGAGTLPVYASLYSGKGSLLGWLTFVSTDTDDLSGTLDWNKQAGARSKNYPGGFTNEIAATGSVYQKPSRGASALTGSAFNVVFVGGDLSAPITNAISINGSKVSNEGIMKMTLSIAPSTGKFSGRVADSSGGKMMPFSGVVVQKQNAGYGFMLGADQTSRVLITPQ